MARGERVYAPVEPPHFFVHLPRRHAVAPVVQQALKHAERTQLLHLAQAAEDGELVVC